MPDQALVALNRVTVGPPDGGQFNCASKSTLDVLHGLKTIDDFVWF